MKKLCVKTVALTVLCLLLLFNTSLHAQITASFTADKTGGCSPLTVNFTNTSTGTSAGTQYFWDFGNGNTSSLQHPNIVLTAEKVYTVTLTVTNGTQSSSHSMNITVHEKPVVDFNSNITRGCLPLTVKLTSAATQSGNASIASYHWDFGDGYTSEIPAAAITHTYETKQDVTVSLTVKNNYGCVTTLVKKDLIETLPLIKADFETDKRVLCQTNDPVQFTNKSQGPGTLSFQWNFGNGQTSTAANPSLNYGTKGTYSVKLTVNSSEGCMATKTETDYLNVANYTADITLPAAICAQSTAIIKSICVPAPDALDWEIDGVPHSSHDPEFQLPFTSTGTHTIKLIATFGACREEVTRTLEVKAQPAIQDFQYTLDNECGPFAPVVFKDITAGATKWEWDFNYKTWEPIEINANTQEAAYTYSRSDRYDVRLKVFNADGCSSELIKEVYVPQPNVYITSTKNGPVSPWGVGCGPTTLTFKANGTLNLVKYNWTFDETAGSSSLAEPSFVYSTIGNHNVKLEYETDKGCKGFVDDRGHFTVRQKPNADFESISGTTICGNNRVTFESKTDLYAWSEAYYINGVQINDATLSRTYRHTFTEPGVYTITMISDNLGCQDTVNKVDYITVLPGFPKITNTLQTCDERQRVTFSQTSTHVDRWVWDFGDGISAFLNSDQPTVTHDYNRRGAFKVILTGITGQCSVKDSVTVYVDLKPTPLLTADKTIICPTETLSIKLANLIPSTYPNQWLHYYMEKWEYGDGTPFTGTNDSYNNQVYPINYNGKLTGFDPTKQNLRVILKEVYNGCLDTSNYIPLIVKGSIAGYKLLNNDICFNTSLQIQDTSRTSTGGNVKVWDWDFGDGQKLTANQSSIVSHKYENPGTYTVVLKITDDANCVSTPLQSMQQVKINGPKAAFTSSGAVVALNSTVVFTNTTNDFSYNRATYEWDFGNGQSATGANVQHTYPVAGKYTVKLTATDPVTGCSSSFSREITVEGISAKFTFTKAYIGQSNCLPLLASFSSVTMNADSLSWNFGDGTTAGDVKFPKHIYDKPGKYIITLTAYGPHVSTQYKDSITIQAPQVIFSANTWEGCPGHSINWNLAGTYTQGYVWDFGDGNTGTAQDGITTHAYPLPGSYNPTLLFRDINGCLTSAGVNNKVVIHPNPVLQVAPTAAACQGQPLQLKVTGAATYVWSPASGLDNPQSDQPYASPTQTTSYQVLGTDIHGCKSVKDYTLTVHQPFVMQLTSQAKICIGEQVILNATGASRYNWINNTAGLNNLQSGTPVANPRNTTEYTVVGYDAHGCFTDTGYVTVTVNPRPVIDAGKDMEAQAGERVQLQASANSDIIRWNWSPPDFLNCTNCSSPVSTPQSDMKYTVTAINEFECSASDEVVVKLLCDESRIRIPNAITPNGDRHNDRFVVKGISTIKHLVIYNRWGNKVFERQNFLSADESACWDGSLNGIPQPTGTYVYFVVMQCPKGETFTKKGSVMVIR